MGLIIDHHVSVAQIFIGIQDGFSLADTSIIDQDIDISEFFYTFQCNLADGISLHEIELIRLNSIFVGDFRHSFVQPSLIEITDGDLGPSLHKFHGQKLT